MATGKIYSCGQNTADDNLGLGDIATGNVLTLTQIMPGQEFLDVGYRHAIRTDGTLWGWGAGDYYVLGTGNTTDQHTPIQIGAATDWIRLSRVRTAFGAGAIKTGGELYVWGQNTNGLLGLGDTTPRTTPTRLGLATWKDSQFNELNQVALDTDGHLHGSGRNQYGELGLGHQNQVNALTQIGTDAWRAFSLTGPTLLALRQDGTIWACGADTFGQCGQGATSTSRSSLVQIGSDTDWASVATGDYWCFAIKRNGDLYGWGKNSDGVLGLGTAPSYFTTPQFIGGGFAVVSAALAHSVAVKTNGTLWTCGFGAFGALGLGNTDSVSAWTQVTMPAPPDGWGRPRPMMWNTYIRGTMDEPEVQTTCQPEAPIRISVSATTCQPEAPIRFSVSGLCQPEAPIAIAVTDGQTRDWGVRVLLDGVAVAEIVPPLTVRAEEGAARIANLGLIPPVGAVNPIGYVGRRVQIDLLRAGVPLRLFTGLVDLPSYDPSTRVLRLACTDDLQNRVAALSRAEIDALTGGGYHRAVHGEIDDNWDYAQACMMTHPASLDAAPHAGLRVTAWEGLPVWTTFTRVLDDTYGIELPRRADIVNQVDVSFNYRFHRLRERRIGVSWHMSWFLTEAVAAGFQYPSTASIQGALRGAGWTVLSEVYYPCPASVNYGGGTVKTTGEVASMAAVLAQRHGQTVTESTAMTVTAPESIAGNGVLARELRCTLASEWTPDGWEDDFAAEPTDAGAGLDYAPDADRADAAAGMQSALAQAKTLILGRHRDTRVTFDLPCMPEIDLDRAIALDLPGLAAEGKVWAVEHRLDPDQGSAISRVTLALFGVAAAGLATPTPNPLTPPEPPDPDEATGADSYSQPHMATLVAGLSAYNGGASGWIIHAPEFIQVSTGQVPNPHYSPAAIYPETGFRMLLSGVPDSHRQPLDLTTEAAYEVAIPADTLALS